MKPFVDVAVILWKSAPYMEALFDGLERVDYPHDSLRVHFVNNDPEPASMDAVRGQIRKRAGALPPIRIHEPGKNLGFSGGNNLVMRVAMDAGHPYVYLLNHDAAFEPGALTEAVGYAVSHPEAGSVQSLLVLEQNPETVNSWGNEIHFLGFGYCGGWKSPRSSASSQPARVAYASGAGVLYATDALKKTGLLDEYLFLYHEDVDLGWRLLLVGYDNVMVPASVVRHKYEFSRSITKMYWMERNRLLVILKNYRMGTLILLAPFLLVTELGLFALSIRGKWWREKLRSYHDVFSRRSFAYLKRGRAEIRALGMRRDADVLRFFTPKIDYQEAPSGIMRRFADPMMAAVYRLLQYLIVW